MAKQKIPTQQIAKDDKALEAALSMVNKQFGEGSLVRLGDATKMNVETISTGSVAIDLALGVGGLPRGRIVEIYGPESSGKTTLCLSLIAEAQRKGGNAVFIDVEHALDPHYAKVVGVDLENLMVAQPECGEDALNIAETLIRSGAIDVVVIDSVAALVSRQELDGHSRASSQNDEPGNAPPHGRNQQDALHMRIHKPNTREDRRDVRQSRNDSRRQGAKILRFCAH